MIDPRLQRADVTRLDELRETLSQQENADMLCPIETVPSASPALTSAPSETATVSSP